MDTRLPPDELRSEFIPAKRRDSRQLMILLHGLGDSLEGFRWIPQALNLPSMNYLLVNGPDPYFGGYSWYDFMGDITPGVRRSRDLLFNVLGKLDQDGFPNHQTVLGGFSQGCLMSIEVGLRYQRRLAGIIGISGYVCSPQTLLRELSPVAYEQRLLVTHGLMDPLIPFASVRDQIQTLKRAGLNIEWHEFLKAHNIAGDQELEIVRRFIRSAHTEQATVL